MVCSGFGVGFCGTFRRRGNPRFSLPTEEKSLWGTVGFAVTAFLIFRIFLAGPPDRDLSYFLVATAVAINLEIFSHRGSDNLSIPVGTALFLRFTVDGLNRPAALLAIIVIVGIGSVLIHRLGILTKLGSMTAYGLGLYYFAVLGYRWLLPVAAFFASSVLFTHIHSRMKHKDPRSGGRNAWQVLANIAVATASSAAFLASGETFWRYGFIAAVAAVTADTWASEIGPMVHRRSFSLAHGQLRESGVSGGLSPAGTLAAVAGSFGISWIALALFSESADAGLILALTASGVLASLVDSVLGAFVEPRLEQWTFFLGRHGPDRISPNDAVNFLASLSALLFFRLLRPLIG